jgi:hypothetical protein
MEAGAAAMEVMGESLFMSWMPGVRVNMKEIERQNGEKEFTFKGKW